MPSVSNDRLGSDSAGPVGQDPRQFDPHKAAEVVAVARTSGVLEKSVSASDPVHLTIRELTARLRRDGFAGVNLRPDLVFTAKGPNSSIEKKASSLPRLPKIE